MIVMPIAWTKENEVIGPGQCLSYVGPEPFDVARSTNSWNEATTLVDWNEGM